MADLTIVGRQNGLGLLREKRDTDMAVHRIATAIVACIGFCSAAQAEILGSGPVYGGQGGPPGGQITCRLFNAGQSTVTVTLRQIFTNTNVSVPFASDTCGAPLAPAQYCAFVAVIGGNLAYSCRVFATGVDVRLRGAAEVKNGANVILNTLPID